MTQINRQPRRPSRDDGRLAARPDTHRQFNVVRRRQRSCWRVHTHLLTLVSLPEDVSDLVDV